MDSSKAERCSRASEERLSVLTDGEVLLSVDRVRRPADRVPRPINVRPTLARISAVNSSRQTQCDHTGTSFDLGNVTVWDKSTEGCTVTPVPGEGQKDNWTVTFR